jgi:hypothetical protein
MGQRSRSGDRTKHLGFADFDFKSFLRLDTPIRLGERLEDERQMNGRFGHRSGGPR